MNAMMLYNDKRRYKGVRLFLCVAFFYAHVLQEKQSVLHLAGPEYFPAPYKRIICRTGFFKKVSEKFPELSWFCRIMLRKAFFSEKE